MKATLRIFPLVACLALMCAGPRIAASQQYAMVKTPNLVQKIRFSDFLTSLEQKFDVRVNYNTTLIGTKQLLAPDITGVNKAALPQFLNQLLAGHGLYVEQVNEKFLVIRPVRATPEGKTAAHLPTGTTQGAIQHQVSGHVSDAADGTSIAGASISVKGTSLGTKTDENGNYRLSGLPGNDTLVFSYLGYRTQEIAVLGQSTINVRLGLAEDVLEEVVVTALGLKREQKALGYAVQAIKGDDLNRVRGVDVGTTLTGRIAGLRVFNSTEFNATPSIQLRGMTPILVVDGVAYENMTLRDIPTDNIENISVLKGATATALYGSMGAGGAIMVTTKKGLGEKGVEIAVTSNNMFFAGYLALPDVQSSYSAGYGGKYNTDDEVWGDKLDIGRMYRQWNPLTKQLDDEPTELTSRGKNNFRNFLEPGVISNNAVSFTTQGENGSIRTSISHVYNKGQYPNTKLNMTNISVSGETKISEKINLESRLGYNRRFAPNDFGAGYNNQGYIYNILVWTGPEYDLMQYKDYWVIENEKQNWHYAAWYDNPYLAAHEKLSSELINKLNAAVTLNYQMTDWGKFMLRSGYDYYGNTLEQRNPMGIFGTRGGFSGYDNRGKYWARKQDGFGTTNDLIFVANKEFGDFTVDGLAGAAIFYRQDNILTASTVNGLSIPGFYSLRNSIGPVSGVEAETKEMVNSTYARLSLAWRNALFVEATGRNDWSSVLPKENRSFFYPSVSGSAVVSEFLGDARPNWLSLLKVRGSWAITKEVPSPYEIKQAFGVTANVWNGMSTGSYSSVIRDYSISPTQRDSWEVGVEFSALQQRLFGDYTYYTRKLHNIKSNINDANYNNISHTTGFRARLINLQEERLTRGHEISLGGIPVRNADFQWTVSGNLSQNLEYYHKLDAEYTPDELYIQVGMRTDHYAARDWERTPDGQIIHNSAGMPISAVHASRLFGYSAPKWFWGLTNDFRYRDFNLSFSIDGRVKGLSYSNMNARLWQTGAHPDSDTPERYEEVVNGNRTYVGAGVRIVSGTVTYDRYGQIIADDRVFAPNEQVVSYENYWKRAYSGTRNIWDETFIKLREISLNYTVPVEIAGKLRAKRASVGVTGQNLFLWTKEYRFSDPDRGSEDLNSPSMRYLGFNINVNF